MSWLSDLAGKAESLLEKVDKSAANALQTDKGVGSETVENVKPFSRDTTTSNVYQPGKVNDSSSDDRRNYSTSNVNTNGMLWYDNTLSK